MIIINLLPIFPLDGYKIIEDILGNFYEDTYRNEILIKVSSLSLVIYFFITIISQSIGLFLIFILLLTKHITNYKTNKLKEKLNEILISNYFIFLKK